MRTLKEHAFPTLNLKPDVKARSEKKFKCEFCESSFSSNTPKKYLKKHIENCCKVA